MKRFICNLCKKPAEEGYTTIVYTPGYNEAYISVHGHDSREGEHIHLCLPHLIQALKEEEKRETAIRRSNARNKKV